MKKKAKVRLPKRLAGVKIPKSVRRGAVGQFLSSKDGRKMLAEGVMILGAAVAGRETAAGSQVRRALGASAAGAGKLGHAAMDAGSDAAEAVSEAPGRLAFAFNEAARAFREALAAGPAPGSDTTDVIAAEPDASKKKRPAHPPEYGSTH